MSFYRIDENGEVRDLFSRRRVGDMEEAAVLTAIMEIPKKPNILIVPGGKKTLHNFTSRNIGERMTQ